MPIKTTTNVGSHAVRARKIAFATRWCAKKRSELFRSATVILQLVQLVTSQA